MSQGSESLNSANQHETTRGGVPDLPSPLPVLSDGLTMTIQTEPLSDAEALSAIRAAIEGRREELHNVSEIVVNALRRAEPSHTLSSKELIAKIESEAAVDPSVVQLALQGLVVSRRVRNSALGMYALISE